MDMLKHLSEGGLVWDNLQEALKNYPLGDVRVAIIKGLEHNIALYSEWIKEYEPGWLIWARFKHEAAYALDDLRRGNKVEYLGVKIPAP
ncbi:hypothetical protein A3K63_03365 [Candidatus Micrarchaeota archaeon RBG_16_49_10]|nr:MAG: hypothetical protein A3K63_03365 [Candidatus Micrarchaeota archaeon RBG_16_49_10]